MNPVPAIVIVFPLVPAVNDAGEIFVIVGMGFPVTTVSVFAAEVPPPGVGLKTVIFTVVGVVAVMFTLRVFES